MPNLQKSTKNVKKTKKFKMLKKNVKSTKHKMYPSSTIMKIVLSFPCRMKASTKKANTKSTRKYE